MIRRASTNPEAGQVGVGTKLVEREGHLKPLSGFAYGEERTFSPVKFATIVPVSEEFLRANPDGLYSELAGKLSGAISRAVELAAFHNRNSLTGEPIQGTDANGSVIGSIPDDHKLQVNATDSLVEQILTGYDLIVSAEQKNFDFTGFAAHPQFRAKLATARDRLGNLAYATGVESKGPVNLTAQVGSFLGLPVAFGKAVSGRIGNNAGTDVKLIGGDFSQFAYGFADAIRIKVSDQAVVRGVSMWETNQVAVLAECTFGWYVNDPTAFVAWELATSGDKAKPAAASGGRKPAKDPEQA